MRQALSPLNKTPFGRRARISIRSADWRGERFEFGRLRNVAFKFQDNAIGDSGPAWARMQLNRQQPGRHR